MKKLLFENLLTNNSQGVEPCPMPTDVLGSHHSINTPDGFIVGQGWLYHIDAELKIAEVWLFGMFRTTSLLIKVISLLHKLDADYVVHLYIHGPGGALTVGCNIITAMHRCKATVITHNLGTAASCASLVLSFGDKIAIAPNATTMFHNAGFGNFESVHRMHSQTKHTIESTTHLFHKMRDRGIITTEEVEGIIKRGEEYFITSDEMIARLEAGGILYTGEI